MDEMMGVSWELSLMGFTQSVQMFVRVCITFMSFKLQALSVAQPIADIVKEEKPLSTPVGEKLAMRLFSPCLPSFPLYSG